MLGLSQLKKFDSDIISLGKETELRTARGEKPVLVPIPRSIKDKDDSEDFVLGMPETEEDLSAPADSSSADDFSDITGGGQPNGTAESAPKSASPDVSDLLEPLVDSGSRHGQDNVPDLSMFMEPPQAAEPEPEAEPEEPSIADLVLDDLLAGAEFDGTEGAADGQTEQEPAPEEPQELESVPEPQKKTPDIPGAPLYDFETTTPEAEPAPADPEIPEAGPEVPEAEPLEPAEEPEESHTESAVQPAGESDVTDDFNPPDFSFDEPEVSDTTEVPEKTEQPDKTEEPEQPVKDDFSDFDLTSPVDLKEEKADEDTASGQSASEDDGFGFSGDTIDMNADLPDELNESDAGSAAPVPDKAESEESVESVENTEPDENASAESAGYECAAPDTAADVSAEPCAGPEETPAAEENVSSAASDKGAGLDLPDMGSDEFNPDTFDFNLDEGADENAPADQTPQENAAPEENAENAAPPETFDTSEMQGLDFSIKDTDSQIADASAENKTDFELGNGSEFKDENADFEIPGFSDTATAASDKSGKIKLPTPDFTGAAEGGRPGKNTLTDDQYKRFLRNLSEYPLNVRIAVEDLLVKNEFTDDAQFEVIQKIINRAPARQVASHLEKMLDISISVPHDYERRTAEEYAAYKAWLRYQLRNRIIPGIIIGAAAVMLAFGLFKFGHSFIYKPLRANRLYSQGYALLEADEYPQSEMKFNEASKYQLQKNWFYKYARGYRAHRQYERAEKMYRNILYCFNFDKSAGIEYAQMECDDLANYEKAEEIAKRDVLDYHINDPDGILLLGDIYLEWATDKDPAKFEDARRQYASLVQLYGQTDLYMSRMMRYFIRTDNLREVLQLKERFYPKAKSLGAQDWTELSGYLLDKLYGELAPADEYLRTQISDVKDMLVRAVKADRTNPTAYYNLSRYDVQMNNTDYAIETLERTLDAYDKAPSLRRRDISRRIDSYRLLGEQYTKGRDYVKAQEVYTDGITKFEDENSNSGFEGNAQVGRLYADTADIDYFIAGDLDNALREYITAVNTKCDTSSIRYRIGWIQYGKENYDDALGSFMKAGEESPDDPHLLLAMGNTLSLHDDNYAAQGYYDRLMSYLDTKKSQKGVLFPQVRPDQEEIVELYLKASNNLGVTLYRLARRTGNSRMNADAMVNLSTSMRAWDALTRNQTTMVRLGGSNLAEQNLKYMTHPVPDYEPAVYTDIPRILSGEGELT